MTSPSNAPDLANWSALEPWNQFRVVDDEGDVALALGLSITLYFGDGHTAQKREAVLACFDTYKRIALPHLRWWVVEGKSFSPVAKLKSHDLSPYLLSKKWEEPAAYNESWAFLWHGGARREDASPFLIEALGSSQRSAKVQGAQSFLRAAFPVTWFAGKVDELVQLVIGWCSRLEPSQGYGGVTVLQSPNDGLAQVHEDEEAGLAFRHPGIEIDRPLSHSLVLHDAVKGGNWLTILSAELVEKLGGTRALREHLGTGDGDFRIAEYAGGILIVAGPVPEIGDRNRDIDTPHLRRLARVLKPIRIARHPPVQVRGRLSEEEAFNTWLARFDG